MSKIMKKNLTHGSNTGGGVYIEGVFGGHTGRYTGINAGKGLTVSTSKGLVYMFQPFPPVTPPCGNGGSGGGAGGDRGAGTKSDPKVRVLRLKRHSTVLEQHVEPTHSLLDVIRLFVPAYTRPHRITDQWLPGTGGL